MFKKKPASSPSVESVAPTPTVVVNITNTINNEREPDPVGVRMLRLLNEINLKTNKILMNQQEALALANETKATLGKVVTEVQTLKTKFDEAIANQENVSPELAAALSDLKTFADGLDAINPDTPAETDPNA